MTSKFCNFSSAQQGEILYLNREQICSILQIDTEKVTAIKMSNQLVFRVNHSIEEVLALLES